MKKLTNENTLKYINGDKCVNYVYDIFDKDLSISRSEINGIYPTDAMCVNKEVKEIIYVIEGAGKIVKSDEIIEFSKDDVVVIEKGEKYYWDANCKIVAICIPKWYESQHLIIPSKKLY